MTIQLLIKGIAVGFLIAAPVGPVGILCVKRAIVFGFLSGIVSGLGAASADTVFAAIAGFGITAIATLIESKKFILEIIGGIILIILALKNFLTKPKIQEPEATDSGGGLSIIGHYFSTFFLTLTNPITIIAVGALLASLGAVDVTATDTEHQYLSTATLILGVFIGSALWFMGLATVIGVLLHKKLTVDSMKYVHRISGIIFLFFGISIIIHSLLYN